MSGNALAILRGGPESGREVEVTGKPRELRFPQPVTDRPISETDPLEDNQKHALYVLIETDNGNPFRLIYGYEGLR